MHQQGPDPLHSVQKDVPSEQEGVLLSREEIFLQQVEQLIRDNMGNKGFNVPALAGGLGLSVSQLNRRLNIVAGCPAGVLIRDICLGHAARLLAKNAASVSTIAVKVGYKNQAHFCRSFKKQFGCSPSEYSKNCRRIK